MTNRKITNAVDRDVNRAVNWAMCRAVDDAVFLAVDDAVYVAVYGVNVDVSDAVNLAVRRELRKGRRP